MDIVTKLRNHALPDPHDEREVLHAPLLKEAADEIERLRSALMMVMGCAGEIDKATDADLEAALECGDAETEKQANAWLVARAALTPNA